jgi:hypothetical protein
MAYQYKPLWFYLTVFVFTWALWITAIFVPESVPESLNTLFGLFVPSATALMTVFTSKSRALKADFKQKMFGAFRVKPFCRHRLEELGWRGYAEDAIASYLQLVERIRYIRRGMGAVASAPVFYSGNLPLQ